MCILSEQKIGERPMLKEGGRLQKHPQLVEKRDLWLNPPGATEADLKKRTLTNLYNQRPTWLDLAHRKLDNAVLDAYNWPHDITDEGILEGLLALNLERAGARGKSSHLG